MKMRFVALCAFCLGVAAAVWVPKLGAQQEIVMALVAHPSGITITVGTVFPTVATVGRTPAQGSMHIALSDDGSTDPTIWVYSTNSTAWQPFLTSPMTDTEFGDLGTPADGTVTYCSDCTIANPCAGGGNGAVAKRLNSIWVCN